MRTFITDTYYKNYYSVYSSRCSLDKVILSHVGSMTDELEENLYSLDTINVDNQYITNLTSKRDFSGILGESELQVSFTPTWGENITARKEELEYKYNLILICYSDYLTPDIEKIGLIIYLEDDEYIGKGSNIFSIQGFDSKGKVDFLTTYTDTGRMEDSGEASRYSGDSPYYSRLLYYSDRLEYETSDDLPHRGVCYINKFGLKIY